MLQDEFEVARGCLQTDSVIAVIVVVSRMCKQHLAQASHLRTKLHAPTHKSTQCLTVSTAWFNTQQACILPSRLCI